MKAKLQKFGYGWIGLLTGLVLSRTVVAQSHEILTSSSTNSLALSEAYHGEKLQLLKEWRMLISQNATQQQLGVWQQEHSSEFQVQQQRLVALSTVPNLQSISSGNAVFMPKNASSSLKKFLIARTAVMKERAQLQNQILQNEEVGSNPQQADAAVQQEREVFWKQHSDDLQMLRQRIQTLIAQSGSNSQIAYGPARIPSGSTPQLKEYLALHKTLMDAISQLRIEQSGSDSVVREATMREWRHQNANYLRELQAVTEEISTPTGNSTEQSQ